MPIKHKRPMISTERANDILQLAPGERVTEVTIAARIRDTQYWHPPGTTLTVCCLTFDNGYTTLGEAGCADPQNFDSDVGQRFAYDAAIRRAWPLFGFLLSEDLHRRRNTPV